LKLICAIGIIVALTANGLCLDSSGLRKQQLGNNDLSEARLVAIEFTTRFLEKTVG